MAAANAAVRGPKRQGHLVRAQVFNPTGCTYSDDIVKQIAALASTAAATDDFILAVGQRLRGA